MSRLTLSSPPERVTCGWQHRRYRQDFRLEIIDTGEVVVVHRCEALNGTGGENNNAEPHQEVVSYHISGVVRAGLTRSKHKHAGREPDLA